jgi:hypothetical protein
MNSSRAQHSQPIQAKSNHGFMQQCIAAAIRLPAWRSDLFLLGLILGFPEMALRLKTSFFCARDLDVHSR